eukprot:CAMPEP_0172386578 /NCGR_PEP_ID=MMETSP1061-20121228/4072_1 /TAXON_ID=37318 /ORGANISM="Pseudo-nitzschia pungens, Strain cf. pungens" /LENGTH=108 /DNA_ID=CAMNT_0013115979 /DNA_START=155 /DNA_END=477 /DNA_ORIENTATION=+
MIKDKFHGGMRKRSAKRGLPISRQSSTTSSACPFSPGIVAIGLLAAQLVVFNFGVVMFEEHSKHAVGQVVFQQSGPIPTKESFTSQSRGRQQQQQQQQRQRSIEAADG